MITDEEEEEIARYNSSYVRRPSKLDRLKAELLAALKVTTKPAKRLLSLRGATKALAIRRDTLTILITTKQIATVMVNGKAKILASEVERLLADGWDVDQPMPALKKTAPVSKKGSLKAEILAIDLEIKKPRSLAAKRPAGALVNDLTSALANLGYRKPEAKRAAQGAIDRMGPGASLEALLREALKPTR